LHIALLLLEFSLNVVWS